MQFSRDFNSSLSIIEKTSREKIGKVIEDTETLSPNLAWFTLLKHCAQWQNTYSSQIHMGHDTQHSGT